jgi:hypothetical protein
MAMQPSFPAVSCQYRSELGASGHRRWAVGLGCLLPTAMVLASLMVFGLAVFLQYPFAGAPQQLRVASDYAAVDTPKDHKLAGEQFKESAGSIRGRQPMDFADCRGCQPQGCTGRRPSTVS